MTNAKSRISNELKYIMKIQCFTEVLNNSPGIATPVTLPQEAR
jgi:hypothetical protein